MFLAQWNYPYTTEIFRWKRALPLLALVPAGGLASGLVGVGLGIYNTIELNKLKNQADNVVAHLNSLDEFVKGEHKDLIKLEKYTHSLYEYTHNELNSIWQKDYRTGLQRKRRYCCVVSINTVQ